MNKYNQSALSNKGRRKIFEEAKNGGVIIQQKTTASEVVGELVLIPLDTLNELVSGAQELSSLTIDIDRSHGFVDNNKTGLK